MIDSTTPPINFTSSLPFIFFLNNSLHSFGSDDDDDEETPPDFAIFFFFFFFSSSLSSSSIATGAYCCVLMFPLLILSSPIFDVIFSFFISKTNSLPPFAHSKHANPLKPKYKAAKLNPLHVNATKLASTPLNACPLTTDVENFLSRVAANANDPDCTKPVKIPNKTKLNVAKEMTNVPFMCSSNASNAVAKKHTAHAKSGYVVNRSYNLLSSFTSSSLLLLGSSSFLLPASNTRILFIAINVAKFAIVYEKLNAFSNESFVNVNHPSPFLAAAAASPPSCLSKVTSKYFFAVMNTLNGSKVPTPRRKNLNRFLSLREVVTPLLLNVVIVLFARRRSLSLFKHQQVQQTYLILYVFWSSIIILLLIAEYQR
mmetsp:Transcript_848/g.3091  ORF Transcript_848/g.3091 Transcript_848/m.3091 type:complete len:371 (-) Transcript_848:69-1181(-)